MEHTPTLSIKLSGQSRTGYYRHELSQISNQSDGCLVDDKMVDDKYVTKPEKGTGINHIRTESNTDLVIF